MNMTSLMSMLTRLTPEERASLFASLGIADEDDLLLYLSPKSEVSHISSTSPMAKYTQLAVAEFTFGRILVLRPCAKYFIDVLTPPLAGALAVGCCSPETGRESPQ